MAASPDDVGTFDEESCRYFLRQVGQRVVPAYPFDYGMEEAYSLMLEKYGYTGIADALSLLQELLEEDDVAAGAGDDGDIWRSWRHQWSRRNCDPLNPYIPRIGGFVLPDPTPKHIRELKAYAFLCLQNLQDPSTPGPSQKLATEADGRLGTEAPTSPDCPDAIQSAWHEQDVCSTVKPTYSHQRCRLGRPNFHDSLQHSHPVLWHSRDFYLNHPTPPSAADSQPQTTSSFRLDGSDSSSPFSPSGAADPMLQDRTNRRSRLSCSVHRIAQEDFTAIPNRRVSEKRLSATSNLQRCFHIADSLDCRLTPEPQRRAENRNTTLVDGIFSNSASRTADHGDATKRQQQEARGSKRLSSVLGWVARQQKNQHRRSWLQGVKSFLGASRETPSSVANELTDTDHSSVVGADSSDLQLHSNSSAPLAHSRFLLDGACDEEDILVCSPGSYLNKPLPLTPTEIVKSLSSRPRSRSHPHTLMPAAHEPASASAAVLPPTTYRQDERGPAEARHARRFESMKTARSSLHEVDRRYMRHVMNPPNEPGLSTAFEEEISPISFTAIARKNPFTEAKEGTLPASQSEPNFSCRNSGPPPPIPMFFDAHGIPESPPASSPEPTAKDESQDQPSITSNLPTLDSTPKRCQSPMKRMLAFARIKTPEPGPDKQGTPSSSSKRSLKQWTNKLRHGFLTADEEEVQREAQMETYMETASKPAREPASTFPISLDPAHQARLLADVELMIVVSANRFLLKEAEAGRLNPDTVAATRGAWEKRNLPQVLEYLYDQATQRDLLLANFHTVHFYGRSTPDPVGLNSTMYSWGVLAREMGVRTFCAGDSVVRKWLNDARRVLELLGAPLITFLAFQDLEVKTLTLISQKQHRRLQEGRSASGAGQSGVVPRRDWSATSNYGISHRRNISDGSYKYSALPPGLEHLNLSPAAIPTPAPTPTPTPTTRRSNSVKSRKPAGFGFTSNVPLPTSGALDHAGRLRQRTPTTPRGRVQTPAMPAMPRRDRQQK